MKPFYSSKEEEYLHLRRGIGISNWQHLSKIQVKGPNALDAVNHLVASDASRIPIARLASTYMLNPDGSVFADTYICNQGDGFLLISEGPSPAAIFEHVRTHGKLARPDDAVDITEQKALFGVDGPFAWELLKQLIGVKILGLRYLEMMPGQTIAGTSADVFRAGKTGEFGYFVMCAIASSDAVWQALTKAGAEFGAVECGSESINLTRMENRFVNMESEGAKAQNILELNCRILIGREKEDYTGKDAVEGALTTGPKKRLIGICLDEKGEVPVQQGAIVEYKGKAIGEVTSSDFSYTLGHQIAVALLDNEYAYVGCPYQVQTSKGLQAGHTVSAPFILNNSLKVHPQEDSFFTVDWHYGITPVAA
jgi:aminomethyltransferase